MGIWNSLRRFSPSPNTHPWRCLGRRSPDGTNRRSRDLRMERFEDRVLLSINPSGTDDAVWNRTLLRAIEQASDLTQYSQESLASVDSWVVGLCEGLAGQATAAKYGADVLADAPNLHSAYIWQFDAGVNWQQVSTTLGSAAGVEYFYPLVATQQQSRLVPNDPLFTSQWHLRNTGQTGGLSGADIGATTAWDSATGTGVIIGVVDDGLEYSHEDLLSRYRADLSYDFYSGDNDPAPNVLADFHGTSVAGVAAAAGNNAVGGSGVAPGRNWRVCV